MTGARPPRHPMQPLVTDEHGSARFRENKIVSRLLAIASKHGYSLNEIAVDCARGVYPADDQVQLAQLIGYSLHGFGELTYVSQDDYEAACRMQACGVPEVQARAEALQAVVDGLRAALREPIAELFGVHPDDLGEETP